MKITIEVVLIIEIEARYMEVTWLFIMYVVPRN